MKTSLAFPSKYIKVDDLNDEDLIVTIKDVDLRDVGTKEEPQNRLVVTFEELEKSMILNKTNCTMIEKFFGGETDDWVGKRITLWPNHDVSWKNEIVSAIRVRSKEPAVPF